MRIMMSVLASYLAFGGIAVAADAVAGAGKATTCDACHAGAASLKGKGADYLSARIEAIASGELAHPPVPDGLSDEDIADIAAYLNGD